MKIKLIGAVSAAALMSLGLAACGQDEAYQSETDVETIETSEAELEDGATADTYADYDAEDDPAADTTADATTPGYDTAATDPAATAGVDATAEADIGAQPTLASFAQVRTRTEIASVADAVFEGADTNGDGSLDRAEYLALAMADMSASTASDLGMAEDEAMSGEGDATMGGESAVPNTGGTETTTAADATQLPDQAEQDRAAEMFAEAAGDDETLTAEELREAFLARFDEADEDNDESLDTLERMNFARLAAGEDPQE